MTITVERAPAAPVVTGTDQPEEPPICEHRGCQSGEPTSPGVLFPGGPNRPAGWGGAGPGLADLDRQCPYGLAYCCGLCGCGEE